MFIMKRQTFRTNFILVIGKYNTSGNQGEMGQAYHDWVTVPAVESGVAYVW